MKKLLFLYSYLFTTHLHSQDISATYEILMDINKLVSHPGKGKLDPLKFKGFFYVKGSRIISYWQPAYLEKYPNGKIGYSINDGTSNHIGIISLNTDSIINIDYSDSDSMIWRYTNYIGASGMQQPYSFKYEKGFKKWEILPERKMIAGIECQRALNFNESNQVMWDVWFYPEIIVDRSVGSSFDVPGLIVEADDKGLGITYKLLTYSLENSVSDKVFWPSLFNKSFFHRGTIRNRNKLN